MAISRDNLCSYEDEGISLTNQNYEAEINFVPIRTTFTISSHKSLKDQALIMYRDCSSQHVDYMEVKKN